MATLAKLNKEMLVLVVDDYGTMRKVIGNCLKQLGFKNIIEANDGDIALEILRQKDVQFIVSDWNMPKMMGIDLLKQCRADKKHATTPFLMVTAEAKKENIIEAAHAGVSNYIIKPFTPELFAEKVEAIFKKQG